MAPARVHHGYFKQSSTRFDFIADELVQVTMNMHKEPKLLGEEIF